MTTNLTPSQLRVLQDAANGDVCRSNAGITKYQSFNRADWHKDVTVIVWRLTDRAEPLLTIGERDGVESTWLVTDAGRAALDAHAAESA